MILYFQNSKGEERIIGYPNSLVESNNMICNMENGRLRYDVGSHTEFFYLDELNEETEKCLKEKGLI